MTKEDKLSIQLINIIQTANNIEKKSKPANDKLELVKSLIHKGAYIHYNDGEALISACIVGNFKIVQYLVENGGNVNAKDGQCLSWSCFNSDFQLSQYLIKNGADFYLGNHSALLRSVEENFTDMIMYFYFHYKDVHIVENVIRTKGGLSINTWLTQYLNSKNLKEQLDKSLFSNIDNKYTFIKI